MEIIKYGILHIESGSLLGFHAISGDGVEFSLGKFVDTIWLVDRREVAETAVTADVPWYNASYDTPSNPYTCSTDKLKVVEVKLSY